MGTAVVESSRGPHSPTEHCDPLWEDVNVSALARGDSPQSQCASVSTPQKAGGLVGIGLRAVVQTAQVIDKRYL